MITDIDLKKRTLVFVYNAKSGKWNSILDSAHKLLRPNTYACELCALTHGAFRAHKEWRQFKETTTIPMEFYHIDEFQKQYALENKYEFPVILEEEKQGLRLFIDHKELSGFSNASELIKAIREKL